MVGVIKFVVALQVFCAACAFAGWGNDLGSEVVLSEVVKDKYEIDLPISALNFKEASNDDAAVGFYAEKVVSVEGHLKSRLVDYAPKSSPHLLWEHFIAKLEKEKYEILFKCSAKECGKKDGYRALFSRRLNDSTESQHYVVARMGKSYKAFYVAEIDSQPRAFYLDVGPQIEQNYAAANLIQFSIGSSVLSEAGMKKIDQWVLAVNKTTQLVSVFGSADSSGSIYTNITLAAARAKIVRSYLRDRHGFDDARIIDLSAANMARPLSGERGRYVELAIHSMRQ